MFYEAPESQNAPPLRNRKTHLNAGAKSQTANTQFLSGKGDLENQLATWTLTATPRGAPVGGAASAARHTGPGTSGRSIGAADTSPN